MLPTATEAFQSWSALQVEFLFYGLPFPSAESAEEKAEIKAESPKPIDVLSSLHVSQQRLLKETLRSNALTLKLRQIFVDHLLQPSQQRSNGWSTREPSLKESVAYRVYQLLKRLPELTTDIYADEELYTAMKPQWKSVVTEYVCNVNAIADHEAHRALLRQVVMNLGLTGVGLRRMFVQQKFMRSTLSQSIHDLEHIWNEVLPNFPVELSRIVLCFSHGILLGTPNKEDRKKLQGASLSGRGGGRRVGSGGRGTRGGLLGQIQKLRSDTACARPSTLWDANNTKIFSLYLLKKDYKIPKEKEKKETKVRFKPMNSLSIHLSKEAKAKKQAKSNPLNAHSDMLSLIRARGANIN